MNPVIRTYIIAILALLAVAGCTGTPETQRDPYNSPDSQRDRASQAQDELSSDTD